MRRFEAIALITAVAAILGACARVQAKPEGVDRPMLVVTDTFCISAKRIPWDFRDSPEQIQAARAHNRKVDLCRALGK